VALVTGATHGLGMAMASGQIVYVDGGILATIGKPANE
jgi:NADP-dependent 3-hydroxy acid dehydrogenase YdfG